MEYRERLSAPAWYWLVGLLFGVTTVVAMGVYLGGWFAVGGGLATTLLITLAVAWMGRTEIAVDEQGLRVGESLLEWEWTGDVEVLDEQRTRALLGVDADVRAFVVQRTWINEAIRIDVQDPADPHPYWLVSSRRPVHLAEAIRRARAGATT